MAVTNEPLKLRLWNLVWRWIIHAYTFYMKYKWTIPNVATVQNYEVMSENFNTGKRQRPQQSVFTITSSKKIPAQLGVNFLMLCSWLDTYCWIIHFTLPKY